ncbi:MAG: HEAT repeat domain-containing protein [Planctomycetota bacterium JB042]
MKRTTLAGLLALLWIPVGFAQDNESGADPTEHLKTMTTALKASKTNDDDERLEAQNQVVGAIDLLLLDFPNYGEKDQKKVVKEIGKLFKFRAKDEEDSLYIAAAAALSDMRIPQAESELKSAMKVKSLEKRVDVQVMLIECLAKHRNEKDIDLFVKLLNDGEQRICVAATKALSEYRDSDEKTRKEIVEELVKQYANTNGLNVREKGKNPVWRDRLMAIEVPMNDALAAMTLQSFQTAPEWQKWYNDNKGKKW